MHNVVLIKLSVLSYGKFLCVVQPTIIARIPIIFYKIDFLDSSRDVTLTTIHYYFVKFNFCPTLKYNDSV